MLQRSELELISYGLTSQKQAMSEILKFIYSEKLTKFWKNLIIGIFFSNLVAFSEYLNFIKLAFNGL